ncbi:Hypothetical predicted protein, partial [Paramuricea clavata]
MDINTNLVSAAIQVCKMKSAGMAYETMVGFLSSCGADVGNIGHGRNQFPEIILAAYHYALTQTNNYLKEPLESTGLRPHISLAVDKSTPHRDTNHAVMILLPFKGKQAAVPIDAPIVYSVAERTADIEGGDGEDLAKQVTDVLKKKLDFDENDMHYVRAVHADGQYQSSTFQNGLLFPNSMGRISLDGSSDGRFTSSYEQWEKIYISFVALMKSFMAYREDKDDEEEEETKYQVRGQDFVIDLCGMLDILKHVVSLMIRSQAINVAPWKIIAWYTRLNDVLEKCEDNLKDVEAGDMLSKDLFPKLSKHWKELVPNKDAEENGDDEDDEVDPGTFQGFYSVVAIVEGFYSVVAAHKKNGDQGNTTLVQRAGPKTMRKIASLYTDGDKSHGLSKHRLPLFVDARERAARRHST